MRGEIEEKSPPGEHNAILQRLAQERAGLIAPPADLSKTSPLERLMRAYVQLGTRAEAALAKRLGPERAKAIRGDALELAERLVRLSGSRTLARAARYGPQSGPS